MDFSGEVWTGRADSAGNYARNITGQCKLVKTLSLEALTKLAEAPKNDVVCVKVRRGKGQSSPALVVMTFENYRRLHR